MSRFQEPESREAPAVVPAPPAPALPAPGKSHRHYRILSPGDPVSAPADRRESFKISGFKSEYFKDSLDPSPAAARAAPLKDSLDLAPGAERSAPKMTGSKLQA
jgi:hypothetical protein